MEPFPCREQQPHVGWDAGLVRDTDGVLIKGTGRGRGDM